MARGASPLPVGPVGGNLLAGPPPASPPPPGSNALAASSLSRAPASRLNKRFPGAAPQLETPPTSIGAGIMAPAGHPAQGGGGLPPGLPGLSPTSPPMSSAQPAPSPIDTIAGIVAERQFSPPEMLHHERALTVMVDAIDGVLRHRSIGQSDLDSEERKVRAIGKHAPELIRAFLKKLPPVSDQQRLRAVLKAERVVAVRSLAALHIAAGKRGIDLAGLSRSGKVGAAR